MKCQRIFTVMCYNVLCDKYATRQMYSYCPSWALNWDYRKKGILDEIKHYGADIINLQEVEMEQFYSYFLPELKLDGYNGIYSPKSRAKHMAETERKYVDGCAIFYRTSKFTLIKEHLVEFNQLAMANADGLEHMLNRVMPKDNIGLAALLQTTEAAWENTPSDASFVQQPILVCTAHIHWDPEFCDVKLIQTMMLSNELKSILDESAQTLKANDVNVADPSNIQLVLCGDFNSLPDSGVIEFLSTGRVSQNHKDFKALSYKACLEKILSCDKPNEFTHSFKLAKSLAFACSTLSVSSKLKCFGHFIKSQEEVRTYNFITMYFNSENDITYVHSLLKFSGFLCISPPVKYKNPKDVKRYKWSAFLYIIMLLTGTTITMYGIIKYLVPNVKKSSAVLSLITTLTLCLLNIITITVSLMNINTWNTFISFVQYIDKKLNKYSGSCKSNYTILYGEMSIIHVVLISMFGYDAYIIYINYGWNVFKYYIFKYVHFYYCFVSIIVILHFASALRSRFKRINNLLIKTNDLHNIINYFIPNGVPHRIDNLKSINEVTEFYLLLTELVDMFNKIFGKIFKCFGLFIPFGTDAFTKEDSVNVFQKSYAVILAVVVLILYVALMVHGAIYRFKLTRSSNVLLTVLVKTALTIMACVAILGNAFWNRNYWNQYLKLLKLLYGKLGKSIDRHRFYFSLEFILGHVVFFLVVALDQYMWYDDDNRNNINLVPIFIKNLLFYYAFMMTVIIYNTALILKYQFHLTRLHIAKALNIKVENDSYVFKLYEEIAILPKPVLNNKTVDVLLDTSKIVTGLFELVVIFNNLFGHVILVITFSTVLQTLKCLNELLILGEMGELDVEIVSSCILEAVVFVLLNILWQMLHVCVSSACMVLWADKAAEFLPEYSHNSHLYRLSSL
ncbi:unnamed protein product [Brassicogethes aeneus]|uniref:poly(A)-specific ribonuclease n=1 Tax=Brassicogethes aeneus TaxID=1431903 RepID=A0A9P0B227_BRAAE|nr:unnamed protein product [Brassicogethes aeneus]